jgi:thiol-disulfide isomerase/thioredoxin
MLKTTCNRRFAVSGILGAAALPNTLWARSEGARLIFVGASWCPACKQAAPTLALFAQTHNVPVLVVSSDNRPIAPFSAFTAGDDLPFPVAQFVLPTTIILPADKTRSPSKIEGFKNMRWFLANLTAGFRALES